VRAIEQTYVIVGVDVKTQRLFEKELVIEFDADGLELLEVAVDVIFVQRSQLVVLLARQVRGQLPGVAFAQHLLLGGQLAARFAHHVNADVPQQLDVGPRDLGLLKGCQSVVMVSKTGRRNHAGLRLAQHGVNDVLVIGVVDPGGLV